MHATTLLARLEAQRSQNIDDALHIACKGLQQRYLATAPELVHHHRVTGQHKLKNRRPVGARTQDLEWWHGQHKFTHNIQHSARCNVGQSGKKVEGLWQCLPNVDDENI